MSARSGGNGLQSATMAEMLTSVNDLTETLVQNSLAKAARSSERALAEQRVYYEGLFQRLQEVHETQLTSANASSAKPSPKGKRTKKKSHSRKIYDRYAGSIERKHFTSSIRKHFISMLKIDSLDQLASVIPPPSETELEEYSQKQPGCISVISEDRLRLDWRSNHQQLFNQDALTAVANDFRKAAAESNRYDDDDGNKIEGDLLKHEYILEAVEGVFKYARQRYMKEVLDPDPAQRVKSLEYASRHKRKANLFDNRLNALVNNPKLKEHASFVSKIGNCCASSDESDTGESSDSEHTFWVISPAWRSAAFTKFLRNLDRDARNRTPVPKGHRKKRGNKPRYRKLGSPERIKEYATVPIGLPRNCYDENWYNGLDGWAKRRLNRLEFDYPFPSDPSEPESENMNAAQAGA